MKVSRQIIIFGTHNNLNKEKNEGIAKLFLPYERGYREKIKCTAKKHGIKVIFTRGQTLKQKLSTPRGKKLEKQGVVYSVRCKSKRCKMEYIGETGTQLKIRMKGQREKKIIWSFWTFEKEKTSIRLEFD